MVKMINCSFIFVERRGPTGVYLQISYFLCNTCLGYVANIAGVQRGSLSNFLECPLLCPVSPTHFTNLLISGDAKGREEAKQEAKLASKGGCVVAI